MITNSNAWYVKWFMWNCHVLDKFSNSYPRHIRYEQGTNLCTFFQILFWGTLVQVLSVVTWAYVIMTFLILPWWLFSITQVLTVVGITLGILGIIALVVSMLVGAPEIKQWVQKKAHTMFTPEPNHTPKFYQVAAQYVMGIKRKFCPTIQFKKDSDAS